MFFFFFSSRRRHTRLQGDWSSDVCSSDLAAGGSVACSIGCQIAIDLVNERGGVGGKYKVVPINADSQSKADVAINEVERLLGQEKVEIVNGVYSSAHAVPLSA